ncbi:hypothetical protein Ppb6_01238 [Photorhabdus australis subsp. thailandensis]|uniref:DUF7167 domain-containing protein n=1 Tax=Photorhabdus australis subsp. thailandensis TaxID=2805096 RepID=A0A1C0U6P6_9GAMM|nr:hypothetical protein [Photorhabdus australis]OCQ53612.1 hypothetical protein Ppb6_01238 [Photorhabdus australis subsp. thailandensis]
MSKQMILKAQTNMIGSMSQSELNITETEWKGMTDEERQQIINEFMSTIVDIWVETADE